MIRFGPFILDADSGELRRNGEVVPIAPQPFRLLLALASRPGQLVTREELRQQVWDDGTFVDFDRGLNFCILQARTALGDDAKQPLYIETLPRRGYRFVGAIDTPQPRSRRMPLFVAAAALLVFAAVAALHRDEPVVASTKTMLAVLPFGGTDVPFADGMTEELITHIGALQPRQLGVIARTSTLIYRDTTRSIRDIGRELGVTYVVEGSVRREGDRVRVTAQLIDVRDQTQVWSESFDRPGAGALAIQRDIAEKIAGALRIELLPNDALTAHSPAAHDAYLRGRRASSTEEGVRELREAIRLEPTFVLAHIGLAESLHILAMRRKMEANVATAEIRNASETALRLAPSLAQSHGITGMLRFWHEWDWDGAEASFRNAVRLNPNEPGALHDHGWLLITRGKFAEGIAQIRRAQELDPVSPRANMHVAWAYTYTRQYAAAVHESRRALELSPGYREAWHCLEQVYLLSGNEESARAARRQFDPELTHRTKTIDPNDPYENAVRFTRAGDRENALLWLRKAKDARQLSFVLAGVDPKLERLHGDSRFVELLRSAGLTPVTRQTR